VVVEEGHGVAVASEGVLAEAEKVGVDEIERSEGDFGVGGEG